MQKDGEGNKYCYYNLSNIQGGSNMTETNCDLFTQISPGHIWTTLYKGFNDEGIVLAEHPESFQLQPRALWTHSLNTPGFDYDYIQLQYRIYCNMHKKIAEANKHCCHHHQLQHTTAFPDDQEFPECSLQYSLKSLRKTWRRGAGGVAQLILNLSSGWDRTVCQQLHTPTVRGGDGEILSWLLRRLPCC